MEEQVKEGIKGPMQLLADQVSDYRLQISKHAPADLLVTDFGFGRLADTYLKLSHEIYQGVNKETSAGSKPSRECYFFNYQIAEPFKNLSLLYRDISLELFAAKNKLADGKIPQHKMNKLLDDSYRVLLEAVDSLIGFIREEMTDETTWNPKALKLRAKAKHQQNPWPVYHKQFGILLNQIQHIKQADKTAQQVNEVFDEIRTFIRSLNDKMTDKVLDIKNLILSTKDELTELDQPSELGELTQKAEHAFEGLRITASRQDAITAYLESKLSDFTAVEFPMETQDGLMFTRKLNLEKTVVKWFDYEILPLLIEIWNSGEAMWTHLQLGWANLKSGLSLAKTNKSLTALPNLIQSLKDIESSLEDSFKKQQAESSAIAELLEENLRVSNILAKEEFLEVSFQSSIAQYSLAKDHLLSRIKHKIQTLFFQVGAKYEETSLPTEHRHLEASLKCIEHRMSRESDSAYDTLFRNKALLGELFIIPREEPEELFTNSKELWDKGFNQCSLVTGESLSGKSTLMEDLARKYFVKSTIRLEVDGTLSIEGRKHKITDDLEEALKLVSNSVYRNRPLILIDDLENWRGTPDGLLGNARGLLQFIEKKSDDVYIMVSTTTAMAQHLDHWLQFSRAFSTLINVNKSTIDEIYKAVLVRHGAAHRDLVAADDGQTLTVRQIKKEVKDLCRDLNYNIGEVLQAWTYNTVLTTDHIVYEPKQLAFEDFFSLHEILLLKYVILNRTIDEISIKQLFGSRSDPYLSGLRRLINTKVLLREDSGWLRLNPLIQKDIRDILKYREILT